MPFRGFIGVDLGARAGVGELIARLAATGADLKLVPEESLHATLKFLGETPEDLVQPLTDAIRKACAGIAPFEIAVVGAGSFPPRGAPRIVWCGLEGAAALETVAARLEDGCAALGFEREDRGFRPHLTLARARTPAGSERVIAVIRDAAERRFGTVHVGELYLKRSTLTPEGARYDTVAAVPLGG